MEYNDDFIERYLQDEMNEVETAKFLIDLKDDTLLREKVRDLCVLIKGICTFYNRKNSNLSHLEE